MIPQKIPRITRSVDLKEYDDALAGHVVEIWVNWSLDFDDRFSRLAERLSKDTQQEDIEQELFAVCAELWHSTPEEVLALHRADPTLWEWLWGKTLALRAEFRQERRKNASSA